MPLLRPDRLVAGGDALARLDDGRVAFLPGALPGEAVETSLVDERRDFVRAELVEVVEPSADRVVPACAHRRAGCGGCGWMHLDVPAQLDAKAAIVVESLRRVGRIDEAEVERLVRPGDSVTAVGYRTSIRVLGTGDGVAYREERSDRATPVDSCLVAHPALSEVLASLRVAPGVEVSLRTSVATAALTVRWGRGAPRRPVSGLPEGAHVGDRAFLHERVAGALLRVSAPSFFQSGPQAAELLVDAVSRAAPELATAAHAVDAYGGVGLFATTALAAAGHVTLIESARSSVADAEENLRERGDAVDVVRSEVGRWQPRADRPPVDVLVADPARSGLGRPGVGAIAAASPTVLVLVSCDPVSLARDAYLLAEVGYRPEQVDVLDLFPQTPHVETVTRFTR